MQLRLDPHHFRKRFATFCRAEWGYQHTWVSYHISRLQINPSNQQKDKPKQAATTSVRSIAGHHLLSSSLLVDARSLIRSANVHFFSWDELVLLLQPKRTWEVLDAVTAQKPTGRLWNVIAEEERLRTYQWWQKFHP
jgi:hypothetical protein